jgi:hypothetical protein
MRNFNKSAKADDLINSEINKQESNFKSRLEEKRKSRLLSTSFKNANRVNIYELVEIFSLPYQNPK